jgi:hypothetical protein
MRKSVLTLVCILFAFVVISNPKRVFGQQYPGLYYVMVYSDDTIRYVNNYRIPRSVRVSNIFRSLPRGNDSDRQQNGPVDAKIKSWLSSYLHVPVDRINLWSYWDEGGTRPQRDREENISGLRQQGSSVTEFNIPSPFNSQYPVVPIKPQPLPYVIGHTDPSKVSKKTVAKRPYKKPRPKCHVCPAT